MLVTFAGKSGTVDNLLHPLKQKFILVTPEGMLDGACVRLVQPLNVLTRPHPFGPLRVLGRSGAVVSEVQFSKVPHMCSTPLGITTGDCRFEQPLKKSFIILTPEEMAGARTKVLQPHKAAVISSDAGSVVEDRSTYFVGLP